jgi:hypothetical protein
MNRDEIIRMAEEAGVHEGGEANWVNGNRWEQFANLVAAAEREWQGLTMEETELLIREAAKFRKGYINADFLNFAKLVAEVEQLLKEKNS